MGMRSISCMAILLALAGLSEPRDALGWQMDTSLTVSDASFLGEAYYDSAGFPVAPAGDVNGDGYDDILVGAYLNDEAGVDAGQTYLVFGGVGGWAMDSPLSTVGASFLGESDDSFAGYSVSGAGDVDGDGYDDILIGAPHDDEAGSNAGQTYVVLGAAAGWAMDTSLSMADASFWAEGAADNAGHSVSGAGDVDGDGHDDLLIGAPFDEYGDTGQTFVLLGRPGGWSMDTPLSAADASFVGEGNQAHSGWSVSGAGDANGDGYDDILIGAYGNDEVGYRAGQVYLAFGKEAGWSVGTSLSTADASFLGEAVDDRAGYSVSGAGDVNGDGFADILIGAYTNDESGDQAGQAYLVLGRAAGWSMDTPLSSVDASYQGENAGDVAGLWVAGAGDANSDGYDDILIGAPGSGAIVGETYLVFGRATGWYMDSSLAAADASFLGEEIGDWAGYRTAGVGDVNADGYDDISIGAMGNDEAANVAGQAYLILGEPQICDDGDGDGYGQPGDPSCPNGADQDCDDDDPAIYPEADEYCNGVDDDCDGTVDEDDAVDAETWYADDDGDGYGDLTSTALACDQPVGFVASSDDCDDTDPDQNPAATETCSGEDDDCDGEVDEQGADGCTTYYADEDGDGYGVTGDEACLCAPTGPYTATVDSDCEDADAAVFPGATETCNGLDDDCDGSPNPDETDADGDGLMACAGDCQDGNAAIYPGALELCDGLDNDCDGLVPADEVDDDADGFMECAADCDDADPNTYPGAIELCDLTDNNCDGTLPPDEVDADGDGHLACGGDCDDSNPAIYFGAFEACDGILDNNCDGQDDPTEADADQDGTTVCEGDCDDGNAAVFPGADEFCNGIDDDCDSFVDEAGALDAQTWFEDLDGDGYGDPQTGIVDCAQPPGHVADSSDCDDGDAAIHPAAPEICNDGVDDDCDGLLLADEIDADGDGVFLCAGDCADADPLTYPGAPEQCDQIDNDCDQLVDEGVDADTDGDGWNACQGDCDNQDPASYPGAAETCDGADNDCDGALPTDEEDADQDGWMTCEGDCDDLDPALNLDDADGDGWTTCEADCDDGDASINSDASEECNGGIDDDCNPLTDEAVDADGDGLSVCDGDCDDEDAGVNPNAVEACDGLDTDCDPATDEDLDGDGDGLSVCEGDCDDLDAAIYEGAAEVCDGLDNDCDGTLATDELDLDGDGFLACGQDCDDSDVLVHEGAKELCDEIDNDCDGTVDEDVEADLDADGYSVCQGDCDDTEPLTYPEAPEQCDELDNDCDGEIDEDTGEDLDGDGYNACQGDCNNVNADVYPGATELCNGLDDDCDGSLAAEEEDADGDGFATCEDDCDDADPFANPEDADGDGWSTCDDPPDCADDNNSISPGMEEDCTDGDDNNCDGLVDGEDPDCAGDDDTAGDDDDGDDTVDDDDDSIGGCECRLGAGRGWALHPAALALGLAALVARRQLFR